MTIVFDALTSADAARCAELEAQLFEGDDPWPAAAFHRELEAKHNHYVAARAEDKLVGYAGIARLGRKPPYEYEIHTIGVDPAYQGQGIGRRLLAGLLEFADGGAVFLEVRTDNEAAIGLYESAGFVNVGLRKRYYRVSGADAYTMRREEPGMTIILAIESSCDETGVGIAELASDGTVTLLADEVASSVDEHARFGGVVPEIASRAHLEALGPTMRRALDAAGCDKPDIVAATIGPGLAGALLVGVAAAKAYSAAWQVPFYAVNHLGGHLAADVYDHGPLPESVGLLVSGGHTNLLHVRSLGEPIVELGSTVDDAAGEAYDKVARLLGPRLSRRQGARRPGARRRPRRDRVPARHDRAARRPVRVQLLRAQDRGGPLRGESSRRVAGRRGRGLSGGRRRCADAKAVRAATELGVSTLLIAGGVAANSRLRELAEERCAAAGLTLRIPRPRLCTDNGAMIASFAAHLIAAGAPPSPLDAASDPGLPVVKGQVA